MEPLSNEHGEQLYNKYETSYSLHTKNHRPNVCVSTYTKEKLTEVKNNGKCVSNNNMSYKCCKRNNWKIIQKAPHISSYYIKLSDEDVHC